MRVAQLLQVDALAEFNYSCEDLLQFAQSEPADPFPHTLPAFPVRLEALQPPSLAASGAPHPRHIPSHLPAFPDTHTCASCPNTAVACRGRTVDTSAAQVRLINAVQSGVGAHQPAVACCRLKFMPISKVRTPREAADEVATQAAAQQQSAQATLIKLHQKMHARVPEGRRNPFLEGAAGVNTVGSEGGEGKLGQHRNTECVNDRDAAKHTSVSDAALPAVCCHIRSRC